MAFFCGAQELFQIIKQIFYFRNWKNQEKKDFIRSVREIYRNKPQEIYLAGIFSFNLQNAIKLVAFGKIKGVEQNDWEQIMTLIKAEVKENEKERMKDDAI